MTSSRWAAILPIAFVAMFALLPIAMVMSAGLSDESLEVLSTASTWRILAYTLGQAAVSTVLSVLLALPATYALYRLAMPGRRSMLALLTVPFVLPTVVVGLAFREILPFAGTTAAIIVAHVFFNVGLVVRVVGGLWGQLDPRLGDVASSLGLSSAETFRRVTLPLIRPAILAAGILVFLFTFTSFGVVLIVGDPALPTIEVEVYNRALQRLDISGAAALALLQLIVVAAAVVVASWLQQRLSVRQRLHDDDAAREARRGPLDFACMAYTLALTLAIVVPLGALVSRSLRVGTAWGLTWYSEVLSPTDATTRSVPVIQSITESLRFAAVATAVSVVLGLLSCVAIASMRRGGSATDAIVTIPLGVSAVTIGFGLLLLSLRGPVDLRGWWPLIPLGQALVALPVVVRIVLPVLRSFDPRLRHVAATLGANPVRAWLVAEGAVTARVVGVAAGLACAISLGEFGATAFLVRLDSPTIPVQVVRLLGRPGEANLGQAAALSVILVIMTLVIVAAAERLRPRRSGGW